MASFNRVILVGNLTRAPELRYLRTGIPVCEVGLAVNDKEKQNGEWVTVPMFIDVTFWNRNAEVANEYLTKGSPVLIEGRLRFETWEKNGEKRSKHRLVCDRMQLLGRRNADLAADDEPIETASSEADKHAVTDPPF